MASSYPGTPTGNSGRNPGRNPGVSAVGTSRLPEDTLVPHGFQGKLSGKLPVPREVWGNPGVSVGVPTRLPEVTVVPTRPLAG